MFVSVIVLAAGKGERFRSAIPKPFVKLAGRPVIEYCLKTFSSLRDVRQVICAVSPEGSCRLRRLVSRLRWPGCRIVPGGARRQDSVRNALRALDPRTDIVLIHDGVRPLVTRATVAAVIREAARWGAAIAAVPAKATIKQAVVKTGRARVKGTLRREELWEAQTPQGFRADLIIKAYAGSRGSVTDDASLAERMGRTVAIVPGEYANIKITTPEDLIIAEALLRMHRDSPSDRTRI